MDFLTFKEKLFDLACFSTNQVYAWQPDFEHLLFNRTNSARVLRFGEFIAALS